MYDLDAIFESIMDDDYDEHDAFYEEFLDSADADLFEEKLSLPFGGNDGKKKKKGGKGKGKAGKIKASDATDMKKVIATVAAALAVSVAVGILIKKIYSKIKSVSDRAAYDATWNGKDPRQWVKEQELLNKKAYKDLKQAEKDYRKECRNLKKHVDYKEIERLKGQQASAKQSVKSSSAARRCVACVSRINSIIGVINKIKAKISKLGSKLRIGGGSKEAVAKESAVIESVVNDYCSQIQYEEQLEDLTESVEDAVLSRFDDDEYSYEESYDDFDDIFDEYY